jgi:hypothetical protein
MLVGVDEESERGGRRSSAGLDDLWIVVGVLEEDGATFD